MFQHFSTLCMTELKPDEVVGINNSTIYRATCKSSSSETICKVYMKLPTLGFKSYQPKPNSLLQDFE